MTRNNEYRQTNLNTVLRVFRWLHSHPYFILVVAIVIVAVVLGTHLDFSQILANPVALIVGGVGVIVGLHILGVGMFAFLAQRRRLGQQISNHSKDAPETYQHQHNKTHHHNGATLETRGETIRWASFYDRFVNLVSFGKEKSFRKMTIALAQVKPGEKVLDVGCGTGSLTIAAKVQVGPTGEVYGTDASPEMIDVARRKAARAGVDVTFQVDLIENITFPDNQFDVVLSSFMMHHLPDALKRAGLAEIYRVLKPGGRLLIVDMESSSGGSVVQRLSDLMIQLHGGHTVMQNNVKKLVPLMKTAGFTSVETDKINRQISYIAGKKTL